VEEILNSYDPFPNAYFESYYMAHCAFLEEGQILGNAGKITHIPTVIINGRYDLICPLKTAYRLHQALPRSKLIIVPRAGHSGSEPAIQKALVEAVTLF
jgi:proline iminopeptidase